jgi:hypothetical protein
VKSARFICRFRWVGCGGDSRRDEGKGDKGKERWRKVHRWMWSPLPESQLRFLQFSDCGFEIIDNGQLPRELYASTRPDDGAFKLQVCASAGRDG